MLIGLTGTYCSGKNHVADLFKARGYPVLDIDKLGYQVIEDEKKAICIQFGFDLQKKDGSLDRRLLGQRVFGQSKRLAALEAIIHPFVNRLTEEWITNNTANKNCCIINAALLHRSAIFSRLDRVIIVTAPFLIRFLRARRRDRLSWIEILRRFFSQKDFNSQYLTVNAEIYRVENSGFFDREKSRQRLEYRIDKILEGIIP